MPEPDDDENDMLDLAFGLTETSRLGCKYYPERTTLSRSFHSLLASVGTLANTYHAGQVKMTPEIDGLVVKLPSMTRNLQASDFKSKS